MIYLTACTHYGHANIIRHCNRPFANVADMNDALVEGINSTVGPKDELWHLGDMAMGLAATREFLERIGVGPERLHIIPGNHDRVRQLDNLFCMTGGFCLHPPIVDRKFQVAGRVVRVTLCHYPMLSWAASCHGSWHFFGHCHGRLGPSRVPERAADVSVDCWGFKPVRLDTLVGGGTA